MYPRNNASPERLAVGQVVLIADGTIQSSGVAITVRGQGGAEAASAGTIAYGADNTIYYTPTQAETDFTSFVLIASKASCFSVSQTVITTASSTAGEVVTDAASRTASQATGFSTFNPATDTVANVTDVANNADMRGTDGANTTTPDNTAIANIETQIGTAGVGLTDLGGMSTAMKAEVNAEADTALTDYDGPTNAEMELRTPTAAQLAYITANAATGMPVTFTTAGGSTTAAVINQVDGAAGSSTNDNYNGRLLVFTDGTLKGVVTDITDYVGGTTTATITAIPFAPTSSHNARLI